MHEQKIGMTKCVLEHVGKIQFAETEWCDSDCVCLTRTTLNMLSDTVGALAALSPRPAHMTRGDLSD